MSNSLIKKIPITGEMGFEILTLEHDRCELFAPLPPNHNHKNTAFGGSLYSIAVLTPWTWLDHQKQKHQWNGDIVIGWSEMKFIRPVEEDFKTKLLTPNPEAFTRFSSAFKTRAKAKLRLESQVYSNEILCASFIGDFVLVGKTDS